MQILKKIIRKIKRSDYLTECKENGCVIGENFFCYSDKAIDRNWSWLITIGNNVTISTDVRLLAHDSSTYFVGAHTKVGRISIGDNVFIGANTIVLPGTKIGNNVIVGCGSIVTRDIPSNSVVAGNPARIICSFEEYRSKVFLQKDNAPIFNKYKPDEWKGASLEDKIKMKKELENTCGYLE